MGRDRARPWRTRAEHVGGPRAGSGAEYSLVGPTTARDPARRDRHRPIRRRAGPGRARLPDLARHHRALEVEARMERGKRRADVNVSLRPNRRPSGAERRTSLFRSIERTVPRGLAPGRGPRRRYARQETRHFHGDTGRRPQAESSPIGGLPLLPQPAWSRSPRPRVVEEIQASLPSTPAARRRLREVGGSRTPDARYRQRGAVDIIEDGRRGARRRLASGGWAAARTANERGSLAGLP